jgi:LPXTG-site transpeptidase (sortase) family protein
MKKKTAPKKASASPAKGVPAKKEAPAVQSPAPTAAPLMRPSSVVRDRRLLLSGAILLGVAALFVLANAGFFAKRIQQRISPPVVEPAPETGADPYLLELAGTPDRLRIPSLGIDAPVVEAATRTQAAYKIALRSGVTHFPGTAEPGGVGNAYFFGHSSDFPWAPGDYKTVFATLPDIELGAKIYITDHDGNAYAYSATATRVVVPSDLSVLADPGNGKRTLTLQTSYPVGTALRRFIVTAEFEGEVLVK